MVKVVLDGRVYHLHVERRIELRRAVLRVLLRENGPLAIAEILRRLDAEEREPFNFGGAPNKVVSDLLRHQVRKGTVVRVRRGTYRLRPERLSRSTRWRIANSDR